MSEVQIIKYEESSNRKKTSGKPVIVNWNNIPMIRNHSIRASVREIVNTSKRRDVVKINLIGQEGYGKTTLAVTIGHLIHKMSDIPFTVVIFDEDDLKNFKETLSKLIPTNYVLVFDDASFLNGNTNAKDIAKIKQAFTKIRHLEGGRDVKIITIINTHYGKGLDKYLRQSNFLYWVDVGQSEFDNIISIVGKGYIPLVKKFVKKVVSCGNNGKFSHFLGSKQNKKFTYIFDEPFRPALFWNSDTLRDIVFPKREWIDEVCSICTPSKNNMDSKNSIRIEKFVEDLTHKFGIQTAKTAVRIKLFQNGVDMYPKRVKQCMKYFDQFMDKKIINLLQVADCFRFKNEKTALRKKLPSGAAATEQNPNSCSITHLGTGKMDAATEQKSDNS